MAIQPENPEVNYLPISDVSSFPASESTAEKPQTNTPAQSSQETNIVPSGDGSMLSAGSLQSPNYVFNASGFRIMSEGNIDLPHIRLGNVNGFGSVAVNAQGLFMGNYTTGKYIQYDDVSGNFIVNGYLQSSKGAFGGDGSDGALTVAAGTTTISFGSAQTIIKNYTTINVANGATLAFSNPNTNGSVAQIKSNSSTTIAGTVDLTGMGASGGAGAGGGGNGTIGTDAYGNIKDVNKGNFGIGQSFGSTGGAAATATHINALVFGKILSITPGAGGGGGGGGNGGGGGAGGNGGGAVVFECAGAWNFTGTIKVTGAAGTQGTDNSNSGGGGGGGGGAGMIVALYNTLTSDAGTYNVTGGAGGKGGNANSGGGAAGGGGGAGGAHNSASGAGGNGGAASNNGSAGSAGGGASGGAAGSGGTRTGTDGGGGGGGGGATGLAYSSLNNFFA